MHIYGPMKSRRLGISLGISLTPFKVCSFDCVYCQLGKTTELTMERKEYCNSDEVVGELRQWLAAHPKEAAQLDYITFSGTGEPTLHSNIGALIRRIKAVTRVPVAVITNASTCDDPKVRDDIARADLIVPSLDAVMSGPYLAIDRPHAKVSFEGIIAGLCALRAIFKGQMWLEIMMLKGLNDSDEHVRLLKEAIEKINPDKIQLNSPVRSSAESGVLPVDSERLKQIQQIFGERCEIV
jgi:wyosine [tRNA(Phe)-imidazoG37] synthetase (radical SAM superfamily)